MPCTCRLPVRAFPYCGLSLLTMTGAINVEYPSISSLAEAYGHLQTIHPNWFVVMGKPTGPEWLCGVDLINPARLVS
jgi:hypothetical protein